MVEQLSKVVEQQKQALDTDQAKAQADVQKAQVAAQIDIQKATLENQTKIRIAEMNAKVELSIAAAKLKAEQERLRIEAATKTLLQDDQQRHEHAESAVDRAHEAEMVERKAEQGALFA